MLYARLVPAAGLALLIVGILLLALQSNRAPVCILELSYDGSESNSGSVDYHFSISENSSLMVRVGREETSKLLIDLSENNKRQELFQICSTM